MDTNKDRPDIMAFVACLLGEKPPAKDAVRAMLDELLEADVMNEMFNTPDHIRLALAEERAKKFRGGKHNGSDSL